MRSIHDPGLPQPQSGRHDRGVIIVAAFGSACLTGALLALLARIQGIHEPAMLFAIGVIGGGGQLLLLIIWYLVAQRRRERMSNELEDQASAR